MQDKNEFIVIYLPSYVRMAFRRLIGKVNTIEEDKLISNLYNLLDEYSEGYLNQFIIEGKII